MASRRGEMMGKLTARKWACSRVWKRGGKMDVKMALMWVDWMGDWTDKEMCD